MIKREPGKKINDKSLQGKAADVRKPLAAQPVLDWWEDEQERVARDKMVGS